MTTGSVKPKVRRAAHVSTIAETFRCTARAVAEAAGGSLGLGKISSTEQAVLTELERAFS